jgi:hypothetical protein
MAATTWTVTSCADDGGAGTLRGIIGAASTMSGDTVNFTGLSCSNSTITLGAGYGGIPIAQTSLTISGPGADALTIDASSLDPTTYSALYHTGLGTLTIDHLTISGGHLNRQGNALGGCVYSRANVTLHNAVVTGCSVSSDGPARGGGVYAKGNVLVQFSRVSGNTASGNGATDGGGVFAKVLAQAYFADVTGNSATAASGAAHGGGLYGGNTATAFYSTISGNHVSAPGIAAGGGLNAGFATLQATTISGNSSSGSGGGAFVSEAFSIYESTVSGNTAGTKAGGLYLNAYSYFYNSTIAINTAVSGAPGVLLYSLHPMKVVMQSTLISNNTFGASDNDLSIAPTNRVTFNSGPANNLVRATHVTGLPADTITSTCPLLGPLRDNGGLTRTHQLLSTSLAIDAGNDLTIDPLTTQPFADDQRGAVGRNGVTDYVRVSGAHADIGAFEVQKNDSVFGAGFDGCNPIAP